MWQTTEGVRIWTIVVIISCVTPHARADESVCGSLNFHYTVCTKPTECCSGLCRWADAGRSYKRCFCREANKRCDEHSDCCSYECGDNGRCTDADVVAPTNPPPSTQPPTTQQPSGPCQRDENPYCPTWMQYCSDGNFASFMEENCCSTCDSSAPEPTGLPTTAPPSSSADCLDGEWASNCAQWVLDGHCGGGQFQSFMQRECRRSCHYCTESTPPVGATRAPTSSAPTTPPPTLPPSGACPTGCRVRKSFTSMTAAEKTAYTSAVVKIASGAAGGALRNQYRALIDMHENEWANGIHMPQQFLPWHRWYLIEMENLLKQVDCTVTIPYWSWEDEPFGQAFNSPFWAPDSFGGGTGGGCVMDGPFREGEYRLTPQARATGASACLRRVRVGAMPTKQQVNNLFGISPSSYYVFDSALEGLHGTVHCSIGGTMCESFMNDQGQTIFTGANAPEFFVHHSNVDKIWDLWQQQSHAHLYSFGGNLDAPLLATGGVTARMLMDSSNMLDTCVRYAPHHHSRVTRREASGTGFVEYNPDKRGLPPIVNNGTDVCIHDGFLQSLEKWYTVTTMTRSERQERVASLATVLCGPPETLLEASGRKSARVACDGRRSLADDNGAPDTSPAAGTSSHQLVAVGAGLMGAVLGVVATWLFVLHTRGRRAIADVTPSAHVGAPTTTAGDSC
eukprot:m.391079 g.391079  ORF g.391079 m.391079 type:complete len:679 (-) comp21069_c0_seq2:259-2295(-)